MLEAAAAGDVVPGAPRLLAPLDGRTEVWAAGVTYERSRDARMEESSEQSVYDRIYDAERPELFFKSVAWRVVTDGDPIAVRADSPLNVPEPEVGLVLNADADVVGYLVVDDVSSRSIEGDNPLYLPQAKVYDGSCAVSAGIVPAWCVPDPGDLEIELRVRRGQDTVFSGVTSTGALYRSNEDLVGHLFRALRFPDGVVLSTGTGIVPDMSFSLRPGDTVDISVSGIGSLTNPVLDSDEWLRRCPPVSRDRRALPAHPHPGGSVADIVSIDPRTGQAVEVVAQETTEEEVDRLCTAALAAAPLLEELGRARRAALLAALADALEVRRGDVVALADRETALGAGRLDGELTRTCYQLRLFGEVLQEGSYLEAAIAHPGDTPMGPRPDLRRMLVPLGPVAVFGASNFPLAFSVPGGDTASALAAGCPVVVKAHGSHPATSQLVFDVMEEAAGKAGAPEGTLGIVHGLQAGATLVSHPAIRAVGFTGSVRGGQALIRLIEQRPDPVPFFGELSSLNPVVVTPAAAEERGARIGRELVGSFTLGGGQFCTKPGLVLLPEGSAGNGVLEAMAEAVRELPAPVLLNEGIAASHGRASGGRGALPGVRTVAQGEPVAEEGFRAVPLLLSTSAADLPPRVTEECFGPVSVVARYDGEAALASALEAMPSSLTATVLRGESETELPLAVSQQLRTRAGRLLYDAYPTGVAVSWAQHHGGPWPSTNSQHTSVGTTAIRRFLRPVTWQGAPQELLPEELTDDYAGIPRRIDGVLHVPER